MSNLPPISGVLPKEDDALTVFVGCDVAYLEHAIPLAISLAETNPDARLHLHVYNLSRGAEAMLAALAVDLDISVTLTWEAVDLSALSEVNQKAYYASVRFVRAAQVAPHIGGPMLILDADCIVRKPLTFDDVDIGAFLRPDNPIEMRVAAGAVYVATRRGREVLGAAATYISRAIGDGHLRWYVDQIALDAAIDDTRHRDRPETRIQCFDQDLMSWDWRENAVLWTGKGPRKKEAPEYVAAVDALARKFSAEQARARFWEAA